MPWSPQVIFSIVDLWLRPAGAQGAPYLGGSCQTGPSEGPAAEKALGRETTRPPLPPNYQMLQESALEKSCNLLRQTVNYLQESAQPSVRLSLAGLTPNTAPSRAPAQTHTQSAGIHYPTLVSLCLIMRFQHSQSWKITSAVPVGLSLLPSLSLSPPVSSPSLSVIHFMLSACYSEDSMCFCLSP